MNIPFFSVLIPVYNVERYLESCLKSVLAQTFPDYEIILVDDGSQDSSGRICDTYADRYPGRIQVYHKQNQGLLSARRVALQAAKGKYICFLDSDDCWVENTLKRLHEIIEETNSDVVLFRWNRIDENGKVLSETTQGVFTHTGPVEKKAVFEKMLSTTGMNSLCTKCCKRELFDVEADYCQYYALQNGEDLLQSLPVLYQAYSFYYLNEVLYQYRINMTSITNAYRSGQHVGKNIILPLLYEYIIKMGLDSPENRKAFFGRYLASLWINIDDEYRGTSSKAERYTALDELHTYAYVKKAKDYLDTCGLALHVRLGLSVFYRKRNREMDAYMWVYLPVMKALRGVKALFRKFLK